MDTEPIPPVYCREEDVDANRNFALLSYISILFLIPLLSARKSKFAQYHANQGLILFLFSIPLFMLARILAEFIFYVPLIGYFLYLLNFLIPFALLIAAMIYGISNCIKGHCKPLPLIGNLFVLIKYDFLEKNDRETD